MRAAASRGFTLLEIIIVIAIIATLAAIIMVGVASAHNQGRIAASLQFASYNDRLLGTNVVGKWKFEDNPIPGGVTHDDSGNGYDLTLSNNVNTGACSGGGTTTAASSDTASGGGSSLCLPGANVAYIIGLSNEARLSPSASSGFTVSMWLKYQNSGPIAEMLYMYGSDGGYMYHEQIFNKNSLKIYVNPTVNGPPITYTGVPLANTWQQITFVCDVAHQTATLYVDGHILQSVPYSPILSTSTIGSIYIGAKSPDGINSMQGNVDDVAIYNDALTASAVGRLYAETAPVHTIALSRKGQ